MKKLFLIIPFLLVFTVGCMNAQSAYDSLLSTLYKGTVPLIKPASLPDLSREQKVLLLDTRELKEYKVSHLPGAVWVGYDNFSMEDIPEVSKETVIVTYCSVGYRSERIGEKFIDKGYKQVYNLYGGIFQWVNEGKEVVDTLNQPTMKVHTYSPEWGIWLQKGEKVND